MSDACTQPKSKHAVDAHIWIGAFAAALLTLGLGWTHSIESLGGMVGISGLAVQKLDGDVAAIRQEIADLRQKLDNHNVSGAARPTTGALRNGALEPVVKSMK